MMKKGKTLTELAMQLDEEQKEMVDYLASTDSIHFVTTPGTSSEIDLIGTNATGLRLNDVCHGQFASRLKIPKPFYDRLRSDLPGLLDENVNRLLRYHPGDPAPKWMIRTTRKVARAALSSSYRRIDNHEIASAVLPILGDIPGVQFPSTELTDTHLYIKAVTPRVTAEVRVGDEVCAGVLIKNSEVGHGSVSVEPLVWRKVCSNGMVIPEAGEGMMRRVHLGRRVQADSSGVVFRDETVAADDRAFMLALRDVVRAAVDDVRFRELVEKMQRAAADRPVGDVQAAVKILAKREGLNEGEGRGVLQHLAAGGDLTRWGMLNAVTRAAQDVDSYDRSTEMETVGGKILSYTRRDWETVATATS